MKKMLIIRHGESIGNANKIIQGNTYNEGLSDKGKKQIIEFSKSNKQILEKIDNIISSPHKRTMETASILQNEMNTRTIPIKVEPLCSEFNAGILAGNTHEFNKEHYPKYYNIWMKRGDLDGIPYAEKGEELQARAIAFLASYIDKKEFNDLIVTHAGFMRCLINTIKGIDRTTPVIIENGYGHEIGDPLSNLHIQKKERAMSSNVYLFETREQKYIVKIKPNFIQKCDIMEKALLNILSNKMDNLPIILNLSNYLESKQSVKVIKYLNGTTIYGKLTQKQIDSLLYRVKELQNNLDNINPSCYPKTDLEKLLLQKSIIAKNKYVIQMGNEILGDYKNRIKMRYSEYGLVHDDLNRDNLLFDDNDVSIIDFESIKQLPKDYQLAVLLVSSFLIEGEDIENVMKIAEVFDKNLDKDYILYLMKIRLYMGIHFFAEKQYIDCGNKQIANEILKKYFIANERLSKYRTNRKQNT